MNNKKLQSYTMEINKSAKTKREKYIMLRGQPYTMQLITQAGATFTANVIFNFALDDIVLQVYAGGELIQGNTIVRDYPTNLLLCFELNNYGLFYNSLDSVFDFYYLEDWYNLKHALNYWELWDYFKANRI